MSDKKIEAFWRNATAADVARVMAGETVEARFRDIALRDWKFGHLNGWADGEFRCDLANCWVHCQVYDPPEWYTNKPDPGEGWRILHPDERVEKGDEYYSSANNMWLLSGSPDTCDCKQANFPYRRRIEAVEPEPKHYVLRAGDSCETPCGNRIRVIPQGGTQRLFNLKVGDIVKTIHGQTITITAKGFEVY
jgi:hypothetical protein